MDATHRRRTGSPVAPSRSVVLASAICASMVFGCGDEGAAAIGFVDEGRGRGWGVGRAGVRPTLCTTGAASGAGSKCTRKWQKVEEQL